MIRFRPIALALALTVGATTVAAAQSTEQAPRTEHAARPHRGRHGERALFRGITLTQEQKTQIRAIHKKYAEQGKPLFQAMRPVMQEARADRQRGDTAAAKAAWQKTSAQREQLRALRTQETADVRAVLTADQQKQFDQNVATLKARMQQRGARRAEHAKNG